MRAGVFRAPGQVTVEDVAEPEVERDAIVIDVRACGICGSDVHLFDTGMGITAGQIMGHEFSGEVSAVGDDVTGLAVGDRVTAMPLLGCGQCGHCRAGDVQLCARAWAPGIGFGLPGAFAERLALPGARTGETVFKLPDQVDFASGALVEPLAVAVHAVRQGAVAGDASVAVLGLGPIGHLIARVLLAEGVERVIGVERSPLRREWAQRAGIRLAAGEGSLRDVVGERVDVAFECTGVPALAQQASRLVRRGGTVVIVAVYEQPAPVDVGKFGLLEVTLRGSAAYNPRDFADALRLVADGTVTAADLVSDRRPLTQLPEALAERGGSMKVIVEPS